MSWFRSLECEIMREATSFCSVGIRGLMISCNQPAWTGNQARCNGLKVLYSRLSCEGPAEECWDKCWLCAMRGGRDDSRFEAKVQWVIRSWPAKKQRSYTAN